ncbi:MAG: tetratricopeptide repeat protein [bacterium]|nr:tetratricopeptide repeat protein [bacterium]
MSTFKSGQCPNCGGDLQVPDDKNTILCMYCGSKVVVADAVQKAAGANIANWRNLAETARRGGQSHEAIDYYNKILEIEISDADAWFGKAECTAMTSTLANTKMPEALNLFLKALESAADKELMKKSVTESLINISNSNFRAAFNHSAKFATSVSEWREIEELVSPAIIALAFAHALDTKSQTTLKAVIKAFDELINAIPKEACANAPFKKAKQEYVVKLKLLDPNYIPPKTKSDCFVATAVMGDGHHPDVMQIRRLRDECLVRCCSGRLFISLYNQIGPHLARAISYSPTLRGACHNILIKPLVYISKYIEQEKTL